MGQLGEWDSLATDPVFGAGAWTEGGLRTRGLVLTMVLKQNPPRLLFYRP